MFRLLILNLAFLCSLTAWSCPSTNELNQFFDHKDEWDEAVPVAYNLEKHVMDYVFVFQRQSPQDARVLLLNHIEGREMENVETKIPDIMSHLILLTPQPVHFNITPEFGIDICSYRMENNPEIKGTYFFVRSPENKVQLMKALGLKSTS